MSRSERGMLMVACRTDAGEAQCELREREARDTVQ
jgi:hypothetical protein